MQVDVLILGAGPAGATAALNLAPGCRTLLLDRQPVPAQRIGESLPPAARRLLTDMGLWETFLAQGHAPCHGNRSLWNGEPAEQDFLRDPDGHGWHLDRARFEAWLRAKAQERGAALLAPATIKAIEPVSGGWQVLLATPDRVIQLQTRVVIDACGRASALGKRLGAQRTRQDRLVCGWLYGRDEHVEATDGRSYIEAMPQGWWYSAALPDHRRVLALHTDADLPNARKLRQPGWLLAAATSSPNLGALLARAGFIADGEVRIAAAHSTVLRPGAGQGWFAVGDAALGFDPLSSQGLFNALYTGLAAAEAYYRHMHDDPRAIEDYRQELARIERAYRHHLDFWYIQETRWPDEAFWQRRHVRAGSTVAMPS